MNKIKVEQLCGLSTSPVWQAWLYKYSPPLYQELADHLRTSKGCGHNQQKMKELIEKIGAIEGGWSQLEEFVTAHFPHMLQADPGPAAPAKPPVGVPFERFDPKMLTFPRRAIMQNSDQAALLDQVRSFLQDKVKHDAVVVGDRAFVEYIPREHAGIVNKIPQKSWLVTKWKREHNVR